MRLCQSIGVSQRKMPTYVLSSEFALGSGWHKLQLTNRPLFSLNTLRSMQWFVRSSNKENCDRAHPSGTTTCQREIVFQKKLMSALSLARR